MSMIAILFILIASIFEMIVVAMGKEWRRKRKWIVIVGNIFIVAGLLLLPYDTSLGNVSIRENYMKVQYQQAERTYVTRMQLSEEKALAVEASAKEGKLYLRVKQGALAKEYDISDFSGSLALEEYEEGYVNVELLGGTAKNVKVLIKPAG